MGAVKLVEMMDEDLIVKPVFFNLKNFLVLNNNPVLHYYSFNQVQANLKDHFKFFLSTDEDFEVKLKGENLHMDSFSYHSLILENIFENLNKLYGNRFKDLDELEKVSIFYEFEYDDVFSTRGFNSKDYSKIEKEVFDELHLCKQYKDSISLIEKNLSNSKIYSQYFGEVEENVFWLREEGKKIKDLKSCNAYMLKMYGLKELIPRLVGNFF